MCEAPCEKSALLTCIADSWEAENGGGGAQNLEKAFLPHQRASLSETRAIRDPCEKEKKSEMCLVIK